MNALAVSFLDDSEAEHFLLSIAAQDVTPPVHIHGYTDPGAFLAAAERGDVVMDALITDLNMPGQSGFEVIEAVRRNTRWAGLPVFVLTNSSAGMDRERARAADVDGYSVNPRHPTELRAQLTEMLTIVEGRLRPGPAH